MNHSKCQQQIGATAACTKIIMEATKGIVKKSRKGATKYCFVFDSWFTSKKAGVAVMYVVAFSISMFNTNTKVFYKGAV